MVYWITFKMIEGVHNNEESYEVDEETYYRIRNGIDQSQRCPTPIPGRLGEMPKPEPKKGILTAEEKRKIEEIKETTRKSGVVDYSELFGEKKSICPTCQIEMVYEHHGPHTDHAYYCVRCGFTGV